MRLHLSCLAPAAALFFAATPTFAQYGAAAGGITGTGTVQIERMPTRMRLHVEILSKASSLKDALAGLKTRVESARKKVVSLGADADSVKVDPPRLSSGKSQQQQQMEMMISSRMRSKSGRKGAKTPKVTPVTVSSSLTAEWPLSSKDAEQLLLDVHALKESIKAADLAGKEAATKLTPEEQEMMEELGEQGMSMNYGGDEEAKPGEPIYLFVGRISDTDREKAMADAYRKAHAEATQLAKAAGREPGPLKSLSGSVASGADSDEYPSYRGGNSAYYQMMAQMRRSGHGHQNEQLEAIGPTPSLVKCTVTVSASFSLGAAEK